MRLAGMVVCFTPIQSARCPGAGPTNEDSLHAPVVCEQVGPILQKLETAPGIPGGRATSAPEEQGWKP